MKQSKIESVIERTADMVSGMILAWLTWVYVVFPNLDYLHSTAVVGIFTAISFVRGYFWRRFFNAELHRVVHRWVGGWFKKETIKCCGTCWHSYPNCSAVGSRLGCHAGHVHADSFALPQDNKNCPSWVSKINV
jgi:hypothetical protein